MNEMFDVMEQTGLDPVGKDSYCVDIKMGMDVTGSMGPFIDEMKAQAKRFCEKFINAMEANNKSVDEVRVRLFPYRDYEADGNQAMADSGFFELPEQNEEYSSYISGLQAMGGGDEPENSLEALALAMRSDWTTHGTKRRHVIMMYTDASAVPLQDARRMRNPTYPENMPATLADLGEMWAGTSQELGGMPDLKAARLVLFTPNCEPWTSMQTWNNVWTFFSKAGSGLTEVDTDMAIQMLVNSIDG